MSTNQAISAPVASQQAIMRSSRHPMWPPRPPCVWSQHGIKGCFVNGILALPADAYQVFKTRRASGLPYDARAITLYSSEEGEEAQVGGLPAAPADQKKQRVNTLGDRTSGACARYPAPEFYRIMIPLRHHASDPG
ncbi:hypothetical protein [Chitinophaga parva]|uniref:hypothetical protein n=1 Tax=Chitinophaga parva TaxID=2169414 RepID=UPI0014026E33|nr:hypothetical protein [Chitinophaga parva]